MKVLTSQQMRTVESRALASGMTVQTLMERAGTAVAAAVPDNGRPILVLVGPGNNGGDGVIAARILAASGRSVTVYTYRRESPTETQFSTFQAADDVDGTQLSGYVASAGTIIDALLGIGQNRQPDEPLAAILHIVDRKGGGAYRIAADIPTGVCADTGEVFDVAFRADVTICMGYLKCGNVVYPGAELGGEVRLSGLGLESVEAQEYAAVLPTASEIASILPGRKKDSNKGGSGRLLLIGGSRRFHGAPVLCASGAYRVGAGLVEVGTVAEVRQTFAASLVEAIFLPLPEVDGGILSTAIDPIREALARAKAIVYGPGLGLDAQTQALTIAIHDMLAESGVPAVIDADGLNALACQPDWWNKAANVVLTPHPGEMSRLTGMEIAAIQRDRLGVASRYAREWGAVVVLKGAGTVVASPSVSPIVNPTGSSNLATAGTGDVLSGIIGGLLAQGAAPFEAAVAGVFLHGLAGDMVRETLVDAGTMASDLPAWVPRARMRVMAQ
jgi:ADP-dependent NAD(P)H-hydrate dehydratase / NAD(P)H-hydrate epimerase